MCKQCPTVGEFLCGILRCGRCCHTYKDVRPCENKCDKCEDKYENKCEHVEKCYECICQEKKEPTPCYKSNKECDCSDCSCKFF